ncbi:reactivating factor for ethanolamine ammonia lyase [compost metagenome]
MRRGLLLYGEVGGNPAFALALRITAPCSYRQLAGLAGKLAELYTGEPLDKQTAVLVCSQDMAKALGYALMARLGEGGAGRLVCLDQLEPGDGDYLDIGAPLKEDVVPVVIKSLIFEGASS